MMVGKADEVGGVVTPELCGVWVAGEPVDAAGEECGHQRDLGDVGGRAAAGAGAEGLGLPGVSLLCICALPCQITIAVLSCFFCAVCFLLGVPCVLAVRVGSRRLQRVIAKHAIKQAPCCECDSVPQHMWSACSDALCLMRAAVSLNTPEAYHALDGSRAWASG